MARARSRDIVHTFYDGGDGAVLWQEEISNRNDTLIPTYPSTIHFWVAGTICGEHKKRVTQLQIRRKKSEAVGACDTW